MRVGIECGATTTVALVERSPERAAERFTERGANVFHTDDAAFLDLFDRLKGQFAGDPEQLGICLAGCRTEADKARIEGLARQVFPSARLRVGSDLDAAVLASGPLTGPRVLMVSGTGSTFFGTGPTGVRVKIGGWGSILGDKGSGYEIGLRAAKASVYYLDRDGELPSLGKHILDYLGLTDAEALVPWASTASKAEIAALAEQVFDCSSQGDSVAADILEGARHSLAKDALTCARRAFGDSKHPVEFVMTGSILVRQPEFRRSVVEALVRARPGSQASVLERESVYGALELAGDSVANPVNAPRSVVSYAGAPVDLASLDQSPTEMRNPRSMHLGNMSVREGLELFWSEEPRVVDAARVQSEPIARFIDHVVQSFENGGSLYYVGAGTSGRLGVLDASECPPTFRSDPSMVQGIMAGGDRALRWSVEGAEDDPSAGAASVSGRGVGPGDCLLGIAASGRTPFVWGALRAAKESGAVTGLLCMNPGMSGVEDEALDHLIALDVGPELLTGSTRLKSGTATKIVLNAITTIAMARLGKVVENLMVDVNPSNEKLRRRAIGILGALTKTGPQAAQAALEHHGWVIQDAYRAHQLGGDSAAADGK